MLYARTIVATTHCFHCGKLIAESALKCPACGQPPRGDVGDTLTLKVNVQEFRTRKLATRMLPVETPKGYLLLQIRGVYERIPLADVNRLIIGRADLDHGYRPDLDLSPYGAQERGVSRSHAMLHFEKGHLYVTDLASANGSLVNDERLAPNQPRELHHRDEITLGRLALRVLIHLGEFH